MRRLVILFLLMLGCSGGVVPKYPVNNHYKNGYLASVSICDKSGDAIGSGTIIYNKGKIIILTAAHVVLAVAQRDVEMYACLSYSNNKLSLTPTKIDVDLDLALVKTAGLEGSPYVNLSHNEPKIGDGVFVIGAPLGNQFNITTGIISNYIITKNRKLYRTDAASIYGNSGGGVFNESGDLVGVLVGGDMINGIAPVPGGSYAVSLLDIYKFLK